jgi:hypothetical protein
MVTCDNCRDVRDVAVKITGGNEPYQGIPNQPIDVRAPPKTTSDELTLGIVLSAPGYRRGMITKHVPLGGRVTPVKLPALVRE